MYKIGALDIETYSLSINAAISDVALLIVDIGSPQAYEQIKLESSTTLNLDEFCWYFPLLDQIELGCVVDKETLAFHRKHRKADMLGNQLYASHIQPQPLTEVFDSIRSTIIDNNIQELWINHTSFDYSRLHTLVEKIGQKPLWNYRLEYDVYTLKKVLKLPRLETEATHVAVEDAVWVLKQLKSAAPYLKRAWITEHEDETT